MLAPRLKPRLLLVAAAASVILAAVLLAGCPLPFEYNGKGANSHSADPSSPNMTAPVTVSYSEEGGGSGSIPDGGTFASGKTTTVTLSTASLNAVIFYADDGTTLSDLRSATKIDASSGSFTVTRTTTPQSLDIHAVAVGPNMLPSPLIHFTVNVTPYPILTVTSNNATISEDGGTATFTITSSSVPSSPITVSLQATGSYHEALLTGIPAAKGVPFAKTLAGSTTTVVISAQHDTDFSDETITLTVLADPASPSTYSVGSPAGASVLIQDDMTPTYSVTYNGNGSIGGTVPTDGNGYLPGALVTVLGNSGNLAEVDNVFAGWNTQADGTGTTYAPGQTFAMGNADVVLYARWVPRSVTVLASYPPVGLSPRPEAVAVAGGWIWVGEVNDSRVYQVNPSDGTAVASFLLAPGPTHALAPDGAGGIWTTTFWTDPPVLYHYASLAFGSPDRTIALPASMNYPTAMAFDAANNWLWVVNTNGFLVPSHFWKVDAGTGSVLESWDLTTGTPSTTYGLCMDSDPNYLWMVVGTSLSKVSIAGRQIVERYSIPGSNLLQGVARVNADTFWLVEGNNQRILEVQLQ